MQSSERQETSSEERFLGTRTTVGGIADDGDSESGFDIEVVDDRPAEDQRPPAKLDGSHDDDEDELESYSEKVQKRIKKLSFEKNEFRRQKEEAERLSNEATAVAKQLYDQVQQQGTHLRHSEAQLIQRFKESAENSIQAARATYKEAYERGDTDKIIEAQEALIRAQTERNQANYAEQEFVRRVQQPPPQPQQAPVSRSPAAPPPSEKAQGWAQRNPWFGSPLHKDMTALAYGIHEKLVRDEGYDPNSNEYFNAIDKSMRTRFPDYFQDADGQGQVAPASTQHRASTVVAPSGRNNGAAPRKVKLRPSQVALAKRLGITNEQYAKQLMKEMS